MLENHQINQPKTLNLFTVKTENMKKIYSLNYMYEVVLILYESQNVTT